MIAPVRRSRPLVAVLLGSALALACAAVAAAHLETATTLFEPFTAAGAPTIHVKQASGHCWTGSLSSPRSDAWRCFEGNYILDPCFSSASVAGRVVCPNSGLKDGIELKLTKPLPRKQANSGRLSLGERPWQLELAGGRHCVFASGATSVIGRRRLNYFCDGKGQLGLWGWPDRRQEPWTIESAPASASHLSGRVEIIHAWM